MLNKKKIYAGVFLTVFGICLFGFIWSWIVTKDIRSNSVSDDIKSRRITVGNLILTETKDEKVYWELYAKKGSYEATTGLVVLENAMDNFYNKENEVVLSVESSRGTYKEDEKIGKVKGNAFKFMTDPLTMYDSNEKKVAYAGDDYHLIAQDSHAIYVNNTLSAEMVGRVNLFGETYDIYNANQEKVARVKVNMLNTKGEMCDANGKIVAVYRSFPLFKDFDLRIAEDCEIDEDTVLMIFCSYYSDHKFDSHSSSNH